MKTAYYDTCYILKLQCLESGSAAVRAHAATVDRIQCALHGRAEFVSACHRKIREGAATAMQLQAILAQVRADANAGALVWLPINDAMLQRVESVFAAAPATLTLHAADALHLACAAEHGATEIFSNDKYLLAAAPLFNLRGVDVIRG
ncbi:MAG: type II toxin-antitoxin system VapC family toxin [Lentisphaerae bacterium]|nr:type II toxin-antitoxin system VapC family toxin [Lentisphaerota bacterium]